MEKRKMENIGAEPSMLGFGCMRFPNLEDGSINEAEAEKMLNYALDHGVTYVDTERRGGRQKGMYGTAFPPADRICGFLSASCIESGKMGKTGGTGCH